MALQTAPNGEHDSVFFAELQTQCRIRRRASASAIPPLGPKLLIPQVAILPKCALNDLLELRWQTGIEPHRCQRLSIQDRFAGRARRLKRGKVLACLRSNSGALPNQRACVPFGEGEAGRLRVLCSVFETPRLRKRVCCGFARGLEGRAIEALNGDQTRRVTRQIMPFYCVRKFMGNREIHLLLR